MKFIIGELRRIPLRLYHKLLALVSVRHIGGKELPRGATITGARSAMTALTCAFLNRRRYQRTTGSSCGNVTATAPDREPGVSFRRRRDGFRHRAHVQRSGRWPPHQFARIARSQLRHAPRVAPRHHG